MKQEVVTMYDKLEPDAQAVVDYVVCRMFRARAQYGRLDLRRDTREFAQEALEEVADGLAYVGMAIVQAHRVKNEIECDEEGEE